MINIIIPVFNNLEVTRKCVDAIRRYTTESQYEIWLVDDASTDATPKWAKEQTMYGDFHYLRHKNNCGYVQASTTGIMESMKHNSRPYLMVLNNDVVIMDNWLHNASSMFKNPKTAVIGAVGHKELNGKMINFVSGSRLIVRRSIVEQHGFYDLKILFGYWEDVEYSWRLQELGYKIGKLEMNAVHARNLTFKYNKNKKRYYRENRKYVENKIKLGIIKI